MNGPQRTCIGCRGRGDKVDLLRVVQQEAAVAVDVAQRSPGRGAYLHRDPRCLELAVRRRAFGRALRVSTLDGSRLADLLAPHVDPTVERLRRNGA